MKAIIREYSETELCQAQTAIAVPIRKTIPLPILLDRDESL